MLSKLMYEWEKQLEYLDGERTNLLNIYEKHGVNFSKDESEAWHRLMSKNCKYIDRVTDTITYLRMVKE